MLAALAAAGIAGFELRDRLSGWALFAKPGVEGGTRSGPVVYYQDPDGKPLYAATPRKTADGRPYRAVHASEDVGFDAIPAQAAAAPPGKRVLYYRNPMGLPDVSPTPKKDSMGMDYIAVHEGEADDENVIRLSPAKIQRSGVTTEPASMRVVSETLRAPGTIQLDERRVAVIALRADAFVESVENVTTGAEVRKGQPLMRIYSPAISSAAAEYAAVERMSGARNSGGSRQKLLNMGMPESAIAELERTGKAPLAFVLTAPRDGVVLERAVTEGMRATTGDVLFRIADHSAVWALIDLPEARLGAVANGQPVKVRARAYPGRVFAGTIALVYPHLNAATRTVRLRIDLSNPDLALLPDMYVEAQIDTGAATPVLAVPDSAVLDSGDRQVVIVALDEGRFEPRPVKLGVRGGGYVEIRDGVRADELVVTSATFLLDAESNLKAALKGLTGGSVSQ